MENNKKKKKEKILTIGMWYDVIYARVDFLMGYNILSRDWKLPRIRNQQEIYKPNG